MSSMPQSRPAENPWLSRPAEITQIVPEMPGVATLHLRYRESIAGQNAAFRPGQFHMLYVPGFGEVPISLSSAPGTDAAGGHTIRAAGNVTRRILQMSLGDSLGVRGPFGTWWPLDEARGADVVIVAGGIGLAPLRSAIEALLGERTSYGSLSLLYGSRSPELLLYAQQFQDWEARGLSVHTTVDRAGLDWRGSVGVVSLLVDRLPLSTRRPTFLLTCGPELMMKFVVRSALARGIPASQIWCSLERNMQCAVGLCGHCQLGPEFLCKDGPVFRYDRVAPLLAVERL